MKFKKLTKDVTEETNQDTIVDIITRFENHKVKTLIPLLEAEKINSQVFM